MRGFSFGALELVPSPLVRQDNVAAAPKGKRRMRTRWAILNLFHESLRQAVRPNARIDTAAESLS